ncbi:sugar phosphate isomerase/epimerase [Nguyenibacter sp. L1]|uniref:sugar phosphate isomerase/epimerase family protein n=1 Tax=Nguyenibacter sp. L1 TaxID=3049350 RepID=UPI002B482E76|nr:sugar phosphate isomerase/epimerase [Nguyenibacter sp. L1]WRH88782.1 sugar phosphate isomerase/epimerase [Nguyenibacter sp. L1]
MAFGVDLVTFYHPSFWGVSDYAQIAALAGRDLPAFWNKLFDAVRDSGVRGVETTFSPFHWRDAVAAFGSAEAVATALTARGLTLASGFLVDLDREADLASAAAQARILAEARDYARFIRACGGGVMVVGMPCRRTFLLEPVRVVDLAMAASLADFINRLGIETAREGVRLALHTEAHSVFCAPRDIDLFMLLTDPRYVHFCPDSAHIALEGGDPVAVAARHQERICIAHWKDATAGMPIDTVIDAGIHDRHKPFFCPMGEGIVAWDRWADLIRARGDAMWSILELDAAPDPVAAIRAGHAYAGSLTC